MDIIEKIEFFTEKKETEYQKFFKETLKKFGVDEPDKLSKEDKKKFFDMIDAGWKGKNEKPEANEERENIMEEATMYKYKFKSTKDVDKVKKFLDDLDIPYEEKGNEIKIAEKYLDKATMEFIQKTKMGK